MLVQIVGLPSISNISSFRQYKQLTANQGLNVSCTRGGKQNSTGLTAIGHAHGALCGSALEGRKEHKRKLGLLFQTALAMGTGVGPRISEKTHE
jgi:hypothetical protein